jgi:hypothetical protein
VFEEVVSNDYRVKYVYDVVAVDVCVGVEVSTRARRSVLPKNLNNAARNRLYVVLPFIAFCS